MLNIIAIISKNKRAMGYKNKLLWKIEDDLLRLRELTMNHPVIMGRKTFESIGTHLPNRTNILISNSKKILPNDKFIVVRSVETAIKKALELDTEVFIIGGEQIFQQTINRADRLYLTMVDDEPEADTFFPDYSSFKKIVFEEEYLEHNPPFTYVTLER